MQIGLIQESTDFSLPRSFMIACEGHLLISQIKNSNVCNRSKSLENGQTSRLPVEV